MQFGRIRRDKMAGKSVWLITIFVGLLLFMIIGGLYWKSAPILESHSLSDAF